MIAAKSGGRRPLIYWSTGFIVVIAGSCAAYFVSKPRFGLAETPPSAATVRPIPVTTALVEIRDFPIYRVGSSETPPERSGLPKAHAERTPTPAFDVNRRRQVFHQYKIAAAHVAPIRLQQERFGVGGDLFDRAIIE